MVGVRSGASLPERRFQTSLGKLVDGIARRLESQAKERASWLGIFAPGASERNLTAAENEGLRQTPCGFLRGLALLSLKIGTNIGRLLPYGTLY